MANLHTRDNLKKQSENGDPWDQKNTTDWIDTFALYDELENAKKDITEALTNSTNAEKKAEEADETADEALEIAKQAAGVQLFTKSMIWSEVVPFLQKKGWSALETIILQQETMTFDQTKGELVAGTSNYGINSSTTVQLLYSTEKGNEWFSVLGNNRRMPFITNGNTIALTSTSVTLISGLRTDNTMNAINSLANRKAKVVVQSIGYTINAKIERIGNTVTLSAGGEFNGDANTGVLMNEKIPLGYRPLVNEPIHAVVSSWDQTVNTWYDFHANGDIRFYIEGSRNHVNAGFGIRVTVSWVTEDVWPG